MWKSTVFATVQIDTISFFQVHLTFSVIQNVLKKATYSISTSISSGKFGEHQFFPSKLLKKHKIQKKGKKTHIKNKKGVKKGRGEEPKL